jgi:hypothetical protein
MALVRFEPTKEETVASSRGNNEKFACNKTCGTSACRKAIKNAGCPGKSDGQVRVCVTARYRVNEVNRHAHKGMVLDLPIET